MLQLDVCQMFEKWPFTTDISYDSFSGGVMP